MIFATSFHTNHSRATDDQQINGCVSNCFAKIGGANNYCGVHFPDESLRANLPEVIQFTSQDCSRLVYFTWRDDPNLSQDGVMVRACIDPCNANPSYRVMDDQRFKDKVLKVLPQEQQKYVERVKQYDMQHPNEKLDYLWTGRPEDNASFNKTLENTINDVTG